MAAPPTSDPSLTTTTSAVGRQQPLINTQSPLSNTPRHDMPSTDVLARPTYGQWFRHHWTDVLLIPLLGGMSYLLFRLPAFRSRHRYFEYSVDDRHHLPRAYARPYLHPILPSYAAGIIGVGVPLFIAALLQFRIRCYWDFSNTVLAVGLGAAMTSFFISLLKFFIGGLRPHFYAVCEPASALPGRGPQGNYFSRSICTGNEAEVTDAMRSFPSGHSGVLFFGAVFLTLYLNAKLKVWPRYRSRAWKLFLTLLPIICAAILALTSRLDNHHHWYDILVGASIGTAIAFAVYRGAYASIWNNEINHIPLVPHTSMSPYLGSLREEAIATHEPQWHNNPKQANSTAIELPRHINRRGERLSYDVVSNMISSSPPSIQPSNSNGSMRPAYEPSSPKTCSSSSSSTSSVTTAIRRWYQQQPSSTSRRGSTSTAFLVPVRDSGNETIGAAS